MLTGMPSTLMARSVPWSRLKPRRKYWLALPSPECCVTIRPGTISSASPGRENGTAFTSAPVKRMALAAVGWRAAATSGAEPGAREPAIERFARHFRTQDRAHRDQLLQVDAGRKSLALAQEHEVLEHDIAGGAGRERAAAEAAERTVEHARAGIERGGGVRD